MSAPKAPLLKEIVMTGSDVPLATEPSVAVDVEIGAPPSNAGPIVLKALNSADSITMVAGEWHFFKSVDLTRFIANGTAPDIISIYGQGAE